MKKVLLTLSALFAFTIVSAQDETTNGFTKGDTFISGTVSFNSQKTGDYKVNQFTVSPQAGYFVSENIALGIGVAYSSFKTDQNDAFYDNYEQKNTGIQAGVFGRYYFTPASNFSIFTELSAAYASTKSETDIPGSSEYKTSGFAVQFAPGFNYFITPHLALETSFGVLGYSTSKPDYDGAESTDSFSFGLNFSNVNFGILYKF